MLEIEVLSQIAPKELNSAKYHVCKLRSGSFLCCTFKWDPQLWLSPATKSAVLCHATITDISIALFLLFILFFGQSFVFLATICLLVVSLSMRSSNPFSFYVSHNKKSVPVDVLHLVMTDYISWIKPFAENI